MPSARPILMSAPLVRALLAGTKTQTRRIAKFVPRPEFPSLNPSFSGLDLGHYYTGRPESGWVLRSRGRGGCWEDRTKPLHCPYGKPGDLLWVKETAHYGPNRVAYSADNAPLAEGETVDGWGPRRSSLLMPRWASRLTLEITQVRVERLQDITEADAKAEGAEQLSMDDDGNFYLLAGQGTYRTGYAGLWNHINGDKDGADWDSNPWVWALTFRVHTANVDAVLAAAKEPA